MLLLDDLLMLPGRFLGMVLKEIYNRVQAELNDPAVVYRELRELQLLFEMDELTQEEYEKREAVLIERLREMRAEEQ